RDSGANQTIDQVKLYGNYALWSVDMALPEADPDPLLLRYLRTTAARAYATANGLRKGVVHLNMPFRKPLEPIVVEGDKTDFPPCEDDRPFTIMSSNPFNGIPYDLARYLNGIFFAVPRRGIIVCGPDHPDETFPLELAYFAHTIGYPILADPLSGLRFGDFEAEDERLIAIGGYETFLNGVAPESPDVVIRFGQAPTSKWLNEYLERAQPKHYVQVSESGVWADDLHLTTDYIQIAPSEFCNFLMYEVRRHKQESGQQDFAGITDKDTWLKQWCTLESATWEATAAALNSGDDFDGAFVYDLIEALPSEVHLFVGNSLPIRHVDQFGKPSAKNIHIYGNRGASGIDGNVSTALGIASQLRSDSQTGDPLVLLVGDITFYHDMNGLFAVKNLDLTNVTIVVMNNNGGGIFNRLPISGYEPAFTDLFIMPHDLQFEHAAKLYGLDFVSTDNRADFRRLLGESIGSGKPRIIEVRTDYKRDEMRRREVIAAVKTVLSAKQG
ncbi:MAG: 2-succinyl-5-enolpyruvyl-6-hydroxy-3-cyclohexene-1-carboxylate synthase, partial [Anaerolineae bacterium]|nr:2-succinyl-5-enolpyruvyl-6-hydroxy-3-cyclohexene-1-carboxylate synthase [Anaerolineae bacterium]